ncbi:2013_t:CDS:2, partial [Racocetra persica]
MKERQFAHAESINGSNEPVTYRNNLLIDSSASSSGLVSSLSYPASPSLTPSSLVLSPKHSPSLKLLPPLSKSITASSTHSSLPTLPSLSSSMPSLSISSSSSSSSSMSSLTNSSIGQSQFWRKPNTSHSYLTSNNGSTFLNGQNHSHLHHTAWNYPYPKPFNNKPVSDPRFIPPPPQDNRKSLEWPPPISHNFTCNDSRVKNNGVVGLPPITNHVTNNVYGTTPSCYDSEKEKNKSVTSGSKAGSQENKITPRFVPIKAYPTESGKKHTAYGTRGRSTSSAKNRHSTDGSGAVTYQALNRRSVHSNKSTHVRGVHQMPCQHVKHASNMASNTVDQQNSFSYSLNYDVMDNSSIMTGSKYEINKSFTSNTYKGNFHNDVMQRGHFMERAGDEPSNVISKVGSIDDSRIIDSRIIDSSTINKGDLINKVVDTASPNVDPLILTDIRNGESKSVTSEGKSESDKYQEHEQSSRPLTPPRCDNEKNQKNQKNQIGSLSPSNAESVLTPPTVQDDLSVIDVEDSPSSISAKNEKIESKSKLKKDKMGVVTLTDSEDSYNSERNKRSKHENLVKNVPEYDTDDTYDDDDEEYRPKRLRPINHRKRASAVPRRITRRTKPPAPKDP